MQRCTNTHRRQQIRTHWHFKQLNETNKNFLTQMNGYACRFIEIACARRNFNHFFFLSLHFFHLKFECIKRAAENWQNSPTEFFHSHSHSRFTIFSYLHIINKQIKENTTNEWMNNDVVHFRLRQINESRTHIKTILFIAFCEFVDCQIAK